MGCHASLQRECRRQCAWISIAAGVRRAQALVRCADGHRMHASSTGDDICRDCDTRPWSVYCRAVEHSSDRRVHVPDGRGKVCGNDLNSEPQQLGRVLLRRIASLKGDLDRFVTQFIDDCPEGCGFVARQGRALRRSDRRGSAAGSTASSRPAIRRSRAVLRGPVPLPPAPPQAPAVRVQGREREMRPFGMVTFDDTGKAKPQTSCPRSSTRSRSPPSSHRPSSPL